jgi:hypothetical protein
MHDAIRYAKSPAFRHQLEVDAYADRMARLEATWKAQRETQERNRQPYTFTGVNADGYATYSE